LQAKDIPSMSSNSFSNSGNYTKPINSVFILLLGLVIAFVLIVRLQFLHIPFERDEGTYCYMGQLVLDGKIPYIGFHEMKPPVLFYSYATFIFLFGKTVEAMHIAFIILNIFTIIFLYFIGKKLLSDRSAGIIAAVSYAILSLAPSVSGFEVQAEHIVSFFLTAGLLLLLLGIEKNRLFYFFLSGIFLCLAFMVKQNGVFFMAFAGIMIVIYSIMQKPVEAKQLKERIIAYSAGVALVISFIAVVLYFQGALKECLFWTVLYSQGYVSTFSLQHGLSSFIETANAIVNKNIWMWLIAAAGIILPIIFCKALPLLTRIFAWLFALLSFLAIMPGMRFFGHYFIFFMPAVALLVAVGVVSIKSVLVKYLPKNLSMFIALGIFFGALFYNLCLQSEYYFNHDDKRVLRMVDYMSPFPEAKVVGDYIKQHSTEKDSILVFGSEAEIYFYSDRRCPSVHCDDEFLLLKSERAPVFQKEFEHDMEASLPRYIIADVSHVARMEHADTLSVFYWMHNFIVKNYTIVGKTDMLSEENTQYVWGNAANQYIMKGTSGLYVYERKERVTVENVLPL
jgi:hypothetical protein